VACGMAGPEQVLGQGQGGDLRGASTMACSLHVLGATQQQLLQVPGAAAVIRAGIRVIRARIRLMIMLPVPSMTLLISHGWSRLVRGAAAT